MTINVKSGIFSVLISMHLDYIEFIITIFQSAAFKGIFSAYYFLMLQALI